MIILFDKTTKSLYVETDRDSIMDKLYYANVSIPIQSQIDSFMELSDKSSNKINDYELIKQYFDKYGRTNSIKKIKRQISRIDNKIPLYDVYSENIYLIGKDNVYDRVMKQYYRFPTEEVYDQLKNKAEIN